MGLTQTVNKARVMHWFALTYARISNRPAYLKTVNLKTTPLANPCFNLNNQFERPELDGERERDASTGDKWGVYRNRQTHLGRTRHGCRN